MKDTTNNTTNATYEMEEEIKKALERSDYVTALNLIRKALIHNSADFYWLCKQAVDVLDYYDARETEWFDELVKNPNKADPYITLGNYFLKQDDPQLARVFFEKALSLDTENYNIYVPFSVALAELGEHKKAIKYLKRIPNFQENFWINFQLAWCYLHQHDTELSEYYLNLAEDLAITEDEKTVLQKGINALNRLKKVTERNISLDSARTWYFIQHGGLLIQENMKGRETLHGKYLAYWMNVEEIALLLRVAAELIRIIPNLHEFFYWPNYDTEIIALVLEDLLNVPAREFDPLTHAQSKIDLLILSKSDILAEIPQIYDRFFVKRLFVVNMRWAEPQTVAPELIGTMAQLIQFPWGEVYKFDEKGNLLIESHYGKDTPGNWMKKILATEIPETLVKKQLLFLRPFLEEKQLNLWTNTKTYTMRRKFTIESPFPLPKELF